ncbi:MAG: hypothetical protein LBF60_10055 [Treponema sp.]|jgi:uncharacterized membrane protein|nr:hypothetical protein [Treponema sp.]
MADNGERETLQVFDLMFKLILKEASSTALVHFINGLFDKNYPPESEVTFAATESVNERAERLEKIISDSWLRLSQNFSFGKATLDVAGKSGLQTAFSKAFPKTNRVLGKARWSR